MNGFQKKDGADGSLDGTITRDELEEIYEMYEVGKSNLKGDYLCSDFFGSKFNASMRNSPVNRAGT